MSVIIFRRECTRINTNQNVFLYGFLISTWQLALSQSRECPRQRSKISEKSAFFFG